MSEKNKKIKIKEKADLADPANRREQGGWGYTNTTLLKQKFCPVVDIIRIKTNQKKKEKPLEVSRSTGGGSSIA